MRRTAQHDHMGLSFVRIPPGSVHLSGAYRMQEARATGIPPETQDLHDLAVATERRNSGIGAKLLDAGLDEFGVQGCWLETTNPRNHSFYERFGFVRDGQYRFADASVTMTRMVRGQSGSFD